MHNGYQHVPPVEPSDYPAIMAHLDKHIEHLERRQDRGVTPYNLRSCAYHREFRRRKLFWMHMAPEGRFAIEEANIMCNQKCFMITGGGLEYLCAILNSTLVTWFVRHVAVTTGMGLTQWDKFVVEGIPIAKTDASIQQDLESIVGELIAIHDTDKKGRQTQLQQALDCYIYELYGLTCEEMRYVSREVV